MKELVIVSGKGGTGKTSIAASLAWLARPAVLVDCDVDAADLHLVLHPRIVRRGDFVGGSKARVEPERCSVCGRCEELCRFGAVRRDGPGNGRAAATYRVDPLACEGCGVCVHFCAPGAIELRPVVSGQWFESSTRCGPMVHARLAVAAENSGKLVTQLRRQAAQIAQSKGLELAICDGSPGIGCPVIASLAGASLALIVVEPTASGLHDFERIARLAIRLGVPGVVAVNKADLDAEFAARVEEVAGRLGLEPVGRVPYDPQVTGAQVAGRSVVEVSTGPAAEAIARLWYEVDARLRRCQSGRAERLVQLDASQPEQSPRVGAQR